MTDPDLELSWGGEEGDGFDLLALLAFLPSVISSFLPKISGEASPRFATALWSLGLHNVFSPLYGSKKENFITDED